MAARAGSTPAPRRGARHPPASRTASGSGIDLDQPARPARPAPLTPPEPSPSASPSRHRPPAHSIARVRLAGEPRRAGRLHREPPLAARPARRLVDARPHLERPFQVVQGLLRGLDPASPPRRPESTTPGPSAASLGLGEVVRDLGRRRWGGGPGRSLGRRPGGVQPGALAGQEVVVHGGAQAVVREPAYPVPSGRRQPFRRRRGARALSTLTSSRPATRRSSGSETGWRDGWRRTPTHLCAPGPAAALQRAEQQARPARGGMLSPDAAGARAGRP